MSEGLERAQKAKAVLEAPAFVDAFNAVRNELINRIERCPMAEVALAEDLRRCLRLLRDVRLNLEVAINSGKLEEFKLQQEKQRKLNPLRKVFGHV
jgi:hypothetical protein